MDGHYLVLYFQVNLQYKLSGIAVFFTRREYSMPSTFPVYRPRKPQDSQYYQCVEDHFETLEQVHDERFAKKYGFFRPYVKRVIYRYLDCGILHNGFARVKCGECGHEYLLPFHASVAISLHHSSIILPGENDVHS